MLGLRLERFGWGDSTQLELAGRWYGLNDPAGTTAALLIHAGGDVDRLEPLPGSVRVGNDHNWAATFDYHGDPAEIARVELVMGDDLFVELPLPSSGRRRFGRQLIRAFRTPRAARSAAGRAETAFAPGDETALAPGSEPAHDGGEGADGVPAGPLELHSALIRAQEESEELRARAGRAEELAEVARHDAEREHRRRVADTDRLRDALATGRALADDQLATEREAAATLRTELEDALRALAAERDETSRLEAHLEAVRREGTEAAAREAALARDRVGAIDEELANVRAQLDERSAAVASLSAALEQARHGEQVARARSEALQQRVDAARAAIVDVS